jgi:hypothetical protein
MTKRLLCTASVLALLILGVGIEARAASGIPDVPPPTCAGCGAQATSSGSITHRSGCPYGGGGGGTTRTTESSQRPMTEDEQTNQYLCLLFPVSAVGGVVFGGIWHVKRLGGGFKGKSAARSWSDYITEHYPLEAKGASGGFWGRLGGLPFLALYPATWSLGQLGLGLGWCGEKTGEGAAWLGKKTWQGISWPPKQAYYAVAGRPDEKPQPTKRQLELADFNFRQLKQEAAQLMAEAKAGRQVAAEKRSALLDEFIATDPDLQQVLAAEGREAAQARAVKKLDAYLSSYRERAKIREGQQALVTEMDKTISKADQQIFEDAVQIALDSGIEGVTKGLKTRLETEKLTGAPYRDLLLKYRLAKAAEYTKTAQDNYYDLKDLGASFKKAEAGDYEARLEAHERTGRILINWLDKVAPAKAGTLALAGMDVAYSAVAHLKLGNVAADIRADMVRSQTARPHEDALARKWSTIQSYGKFAANTEREAGIRMDYFSELEKKHAK